MESDLRHLLARCVQCGKCRVVCPVFHVTRNETDAARGRLHIVDHAGELPLSEVRRVLQRCLLCGACEAQCPQETPVTELIRAARSQWAPSSLKAAVASWMADPARLSLLGEQGRTIAAILGRRLADDSGLRLRLAPASLQRRFPKPPQRSFLETHGEAKPDGDTALFVGCVMNNLLRRVPEAALQAYRTIDRNVAVPKEQACCGLMAFGAGDTVGAKKAALAFMRTFERFDKIVTVCASCTTMLTEHLPEVLPEAAPLAKRVVDVHDDLLGAGFVPQTAERFRGVRIGYHAPCHYRFGHPEDAPLRFLKALPDTETEELAPQCCGMGGSFAASNPTLSAKIASDRRAGIGNQDVLATSCSGCYLGLFDAAKTIKPIPQVVHPLEILVDR